MSDEKRVRTLAKLYEARETMRRLYGEEYNAELKPYQDIIAHAAKAQRRSALSMAIEMAREISGTQLILCLCAGLELEEKT